ncbi:hypothetical protein BH10BAC5_BH10BAC5_17630 [soil metagenome]
MVLKEIHNILTEFSVIETKDFKKFICAAKTHNRQKLIEFSDYLISRARNNELSELTVKRIRTNKSFKYNFRNDAYEYLALFIDLLNDFIFFRKFKHKDINKKLFLLRHHIGLGNSKMQHKIDSQLQGMLFKGLQDNRLNYFKYLYADEMMFKIYETSTKRKVEEGEQNINLYEQSFQSLTKYYFCEVVSIYTQFIKDQSNFNITDTYPELTQLRDTAENIYSQMDKSFQEDIMVKLFYNQFLCFRYPDVFLYYKNYRSYLKSIEKNITSNELKVQYSNILNYCIIKDKESKPSEYNIRELLSLSKIFIKNKFYIDSNVKKFLPPAAFRNVVILSERLRDAGSIEELIHENSGELDPKFRKDFINYAYVLYYYLKNDAKSSLKYSFKVPNLYTGVLLDTKRINIMNYYTLGKLENAEKELNSFRELVRRQKTISLIVKTRFFTFCKYSEKLILKNNSFASLSYSRAKLVEEDWFPSKDWLIEKYSDLLEKKAS